MIAEETGVGDSAAHIYLHSPLLTQGQYETREFFVWRLALLAHQYPRALWLLCEPRWRLGSDPKKSAPMALWEAYEERWLLRNPARAPPMLVQFLSTDQLYSGKSKKRTMFSRPLRAGEPVPAAGTDLYALLEEASAYVRQTYDDAAADVAARTAAAGAWASRVAALQIAAPTTPAARKIMGDFLEYCTHEKTDMRSRVGDANTMMRGQPMSEDLMRECIGHLDSVARAAAQAILLGRGRDIAFDAAANAYALALGVPYVRLTTASLREKMPAAIIADDTQGDLANAVYQAFARQAVDGPLHAVKTGHTRIDLLRHTTGNKNLVMPGARPPDVNTANNPETTRTQKQRRLWYLEKQLLELEAEGGDADAVIAEIAELRGVLLITKPPRAKNDTPKPPSAKNDTPKPPSAKNDTPKQKLAPDAETSESKRTAVPSNADSAVVNGVLPGVVWYACEDLDYKTVNGALEYRADALGRRVLVVRRHQDDAVAISECKLGTLPYALLADGPVVHIELETGWAKGEIEADAIDPYTGFYTRARYVVEVPWQYGVWVREIGGQRITDESGQHILVQALLLQPERNWAVRVLETGLVYVYGPNRLPVRDARTGEPLLAPVAVVPNYEIDQHPLPPTTLPSSSSSAGSGVSALSTAPLLLPGSPSSAARVVGVSESSNPVDDAVLFGLLGDAAHDPNALQTAHHFAESDQAGTPSAGVTSDADADYSTQLSPSQVDLFDSWPWTSARIGASPLVAALIAGRLCAAY